MVRYELAVIRNEEQLALFKFVTDQPFYFFEDREPWEERDEDPELREDGQIIGWCHSYTMEASPFIEWLNNENDGLHEISEFIRILENQYPGEIEYELRQ